MEKCVCSFQAFTLFSKTADAEASRSLTVPRNASPINNESNENDVHSFSQSENLWLRHFLLYSMGQSYNSNECGTFLYFYAIFGWARLIYHNTFMTYVMTNAPIHCKVWYTSKKVFRHVNFTALSYWEEIASGRLFNAPSNWETMTTVLNVEVRLLLYSRKI